MNVRHDRNDILIKGISLIRERGYANTGIQDILKACDIPKGSFYNFFVSKEAFALEAMELYSKLIIQFLEEVDNNEGLTAEDKIRTFFLKANSLYKSGQSDKNCLLLALATEVTKEDNVFSEPISTNFSTYKDYLVKWITQAQADNKIKNKFNAKELANIIYDGYHGAILRMKYQLNTKALDDFMDYTLRILYQ